MALSLSVPSKTFLIGEYGVLSGGPALVLNTQPRFRLSVDSGIGVQPSNLSKESQAFKLWSEIGSADTPLQLEVFDPHHGQGGLGRSSAEFLALYTYLFPNKNLSTADDQKHLLQTYRKISARPGAVTPSGADVVSQAVGGLTHFDGQIGMCWAWPFQALSFVLLRTGVKVPTHQHLETIDSESFAELADITRASVPAIQNGEASEFIRTLKAFQDRLSSGGLVLRSTGEMIEEIKKLRGVVSAKGCGALGADVVLVLVESESKQRLISELRGRWEVISTESDLSGGVCIESQFEKPRTNEQRAKNVES